jgi:hypothetical protein
MFDELLAPERLAGGAFMATLIELLYAVPPDAFTLTEYMPGEAMPLGMVKFKVVPSLETFDIVAEVLAEFVTVTVFPVALKPEPVRATALVEALIVADVRIGALTLELTGIAIVTEPT